MICRFSKVMFFLSEYQGSQNNEGLGEFRMSNGGLDLTSKF